MSAHDERAIRAVLALVPTQREAVKLLVDAIPLPEIAARLTVSEEKILDWLLYSPAFMHAYRARQWLMNELEDNLKRCTRITLLDRMLDAAEDASPIDAAKSLSALRALGPAAPTSPPPGPSELLDEQVERRYRAVERDLTEYGQHEYIASVHGIPEPDRTDIRVELIHELAHHLDVDDTTQAVDDGTPIRR